MTKGFDHSLRASAPRSLSIRAALEWAFGVEHAQLDFDDLRPQGARPGCDTIWRLMQQGALGCQIDGGGGPARVADDAEVIANAVADLPIEVGGRSMAVAIAEWARAGVVPDWRVDMTRRCLPRAWAAENQHGLFAKTVKVDEVELVSRGRLVRHPVLCCPVIHVAPSAQQISAKRRAWLAWYGALLHLRSVLGRGALTSVRLTDAMPPLEPWAAVASADYKAA